MQGTFWALVPTLMAVIISLVTKEVYLSLLAGILTGALLIAGPSFDALSELFDVMAQKTGAGESGLGNAGILIFIAELGMLVALIGKSGGTARLSYLLCGRIKTKRGAMLSATGLGCLIFMDDYFNRLAVGTVMSPVFDKLGLSRTKLAFVAGSVSVSICILVPVSSWASAITANIGEGDAFGLYLRTLTCNFYPILMLGFLVISALIAGKSGETANNVPDVLVAPKGKAIDLILPIAVLVASSFALMARYDSETALAMGGGLAILLCFVFYTTRKVMTPKEFAVCLSDGLKSVADVILILVLAWTLTGMCERLDIASFIGGLTGKMGEAQSLLPGIMFVAAMGTAFATGTAWGTFGMLVPIAVPMFEPFSALQILTVSAVLSGSVFGNQVSPISDSTILAAKVCECDHMGLIKAQLPCALTIAGVAFCGFLAAGLSGCIWAGWVTAAAASVPLIIVFAHKNSLKKCGRISPAKRNLKEKRRL